MCMCLMYLTFHRMATTRQQTSQNNMPLYQQLLNRHESNAHSHQCPTALSAGQSRGSPCPSNHVKVCVRHSAGPVGFGFRWASSRLPCQATTAIRASWATACCPPHSARSTCCSSRPCSPGAANAKCLGHGCSCACSSGYATSPCTFLGTATCWLSRSKCEFGGRLCRNFAVLP